MRSQARCYGAACQLLEAGRVCPRAPVDIAVASVSCLMRCHDCFTTVRVRADSCSWPIGAAWPFLAWSHRDGTHCWNIYTASGELARTMAGPHSFFGSGAGGISSPQASLQIAWASRFNDCSIRLPLLRHGLKVPQVTVVFALSAAFGLANVLTPPDISGNRHGRTCVVVSAVPVPDTNQPGHVSLCANVKRRVCGFSLDGNVKRFASPASAWGGGEISAQDLVANLWVPREGGVSGPLFRGSLGD